MKFKTQEKLRKEFNLIENDLFKQLIATGEHFRNQQEKIVAQMIQNGFTAQAEDIKKQMDFWYQQYEKFLERLKSEKFWEYCKGYDEFKKEVLQLEGIMKGIEKKIVICLTPEQIEQFTKEYDAFWKDTYKTWSSSLDTSSMTFTPEFTSFINFKDLAAEPDDTTKFGQYLTNPETALLDYETLGEPEIFDPNTDTGYHAWLVQHKKTKSVASVMDYVHETYALTHHFPGIEYQKYLFENPDKVPQSMRDGNYYYFPGSAFRSSDGSWVAPYGLWDGGVWRRVGRDVRDGWSSCGQVVLFGKLSLSTESLK